MTDLRPGWMSLSRGATSPTARSTSRFLPRTWARRRGRGPADYLDPVRSARRLTSLRISLPSLAN